MPHSTIIQRAVRPALLTLLTGVVLLFSSGSFARARTRSRAPKTQPTIVLVHGAWANGSSWNGVIRRLQREGYNVDAPPNPLRGLTSDSTYLASFLKTVTGPIILVGHSYGGAVITNAATGNPNVKALVYVDGFIPAQGDTVLGLAGAMPGSTLADPDTAFNFVPFTDAAGSDTDLFVKPSVSGRTSERISASKRTRSWLPPRSRWPPVPWSSRRARRRGRRYGPMTSSAPGTRSFPRPSRPSWPTGLTRPSSRSREDHTSP